MRTAAHVLVGYALLLVTGAVWRHLPLHYAAPDLLALVALYLGLTARPVIVGNLALRMSPAALGAIILGYLADLLSGSPRGTLALAAGLVCVAGQLIHRHLLVRGRLATMALAFFAGLFSGLVVLLVRAWGGRLGLGAGREAGILFACALLTGLVGPLVFRLCRAIDARFARTARERDAALGGITQ